MDQIQAFISQRRNLGQSDTDIAVALLNAGWDESQVRTALSNQPPISAHANNQLLDHSPKPPITSPSPLEQTIHRKPLSKLLMIVPFTLVLLGIILGVHTLFIG